ncbi:hypothetical protein PV326_000146 [Microctonus aethiopoides]|nr:hypothetical protein PV326_000146 [Microctonus aethiopoides]
MSRDSCVNLSELPREIAMGIVWKSPALHNLLYTVILWIGTAQLGGDSSEVNGRPEQRRGPSGPRIKTMKIWKQPRVENGEFASREIQEQQILVTLMQYTHK